MSWGGLLGFGGFDTSNSVSVVKFYMLGAPWNNFLALVFCDAAGVEFAEELWRWKERGWAVKEAFALDKRLNYGGGVAYWTSGSSSLTQ